MKKFIYFAAVLSAFMTSCNSDNEIIDKDPVIKSTSTITATFDQPVSRVQMGTSDGTNTPLQWNAGDQLAVYNVTSHTFGKYATASTVADGALTAVFNFVEQAGTSAIVPEEPHLAAYPFDRIAATTFEFRYRTTQTYTENSFDRLAMPMVASNASGTEFSFKAQAAVLRLKVSTTASDVAVNSIEITSASMALTGYAAPDMVNGTYGVPTENTSNTVTLNCATPVAINSTPTEFNIIVPGQTYPSGDLTITVKTNKGNFEKTSKTAATFAAGKVYNLNISGAPMAFGTGTAKRTGDIDVKWVQLWENGPKFAEYNVGVTDGKAESYGEYYAWGGKQDKVDDHNTGSTELTGSDDTATYLWGNNWRMPSAIEFSALRAKCTETWTNNYNGTGIKGIIYTGKGDYASNSIFLPAAGRYESELFDQSMLGRYWSSTVAVNLYFDSGSKNVQSDDRNRGCSVRAVLAEDPVFTTTGTATATINGSDVDVTWVQLWPGGPKFADRDVPVTTMPMTFAEATAEPFVWGSNWCTPSKADMDELVKAASSAGSIWVKCEYVDEGSGYGFKFTGKQVGYTGTSVFLPIEYGNGSQGAKQYWSSTKYGTEKAWRIYLLYSSGILKSYWQEMDIYVQRYNVRPVLKN